MGTTYWQTAEFHRACDEDRLRSFNQQYGVIETVDELRGWHLAGSEHYKDGVLRITLTRQTNNGHEMHQGFCDIAILRLARELGYIAKSNGYMLP